MCSNQPNHVHTGTNSIRSFIKILRQKYTKGGLVLTKSTDSLHATEINTSRWGIQKRFTERNVFFHKSEGGTLSREGQKSLKLRLSFL